MDLLYFSTAIIAPYEGLCIQFSSFLTQPKKIIDIYRINK